VVAPLHKQVTASVNAARPILVTMVLREGAQPRDLITKSIGKERIFFKPK
jgi:hypothetical protein